MAYVPREVAAAVEILLVVGMVFRTTWALSWTCLACIFTSMLYFTM